MVKQENKETLYRAYVTDMLKNIVNNSAGGESRSIVETRYMDLVEKQTKKPEKEKKPEETNESVIARMKKKLSKY